MSNSPDGPEEVRDTIIPQDAVPEELPRDTLPPQEQVAAPPTWPRRDADVRARTGLALGSGVALLVAAAGLAPVVTVVALIWASGEPIGTAPAAALLAAPSVDFAALRAAIPAAPAVVASPAVVEAAPAEPDPSLYAFARLANRVYDTREVWRKSGQSGRELFRTASAAELGGAAFVDELKLGPRRFVWLRREAKVLAPADAQVPDGISMKDASNDPGPKLFDGTLDGKPTRAIRSCMFGETYCLVDVVDLATTASTPSAPVAAGAASPVEDRQRMAAFDAAVDREENKLAAWARPVADGAARSASSSTRTVPLLPMLAGLGLAAVLVGVAVVRLRKLAAAVVGANARLRAAAAGRLEAPRAARSHTAELADLEATVDEVSAALGDGAARAETASRRRARLGELAAALGAAVDGRLDARAPVASDDDAALAALAASTNAALESFDARVLRWRSHLAAAAPTASQSEPLRALRSELSAVVTSSSAPALVGAMRDLPPGEIARRLPESPS